MLVGRPPRADRIQGGAVECRTEAARPIPISSGSHGPLRTTLDTGIPIQGAPDQALGRSRGGLSTKVHLAVRGLGCPVRIILTAGQKGDAPQATALLGPDRPHVVLADAAYDADPFRALVRARGGRTVIPSNPSRAMKHPLDKPLYRERHLIECCIGKLKQFRRVATRYEKTARNYLAVVTLAATSLWLK